MNLRTRRFESFIYFMFLLFLLMGCGRNNSFQPTSSDRAVSDAGSLYPQIVMVVFPSGICSGGIIGEHVVITAAHCLTDSSSGASYSILKEGIRYDADGVLTTGCATVDCGNDMGLLFFNAPISTVGVDTIIAINPHSTEGEHVTVVGYGTDDNFHKTGGGTKRYGFNNIAYLGSFLELWSNLATCKGYGRVACTMTDAASGYGDSGATILADDGSAVAIVHAGGTNDQYMVSEAVRLTGANYNWLKNSIAANPSYSSGVTFIP